MSETPRANTRRTLAAALVVLPLIAALIAVNTPLRSASAAPTPATGDATWGIRESYRGYIAGPIADGEIIASDGATWLDGTGNAKGPFEFPVVDATFDDATETGLVTFGGTVYSGGHDYGSGYILEAEWSNIRLEIDGDTGTIFADMVFRPFIGANPSIPPPPQQTVADVEFATVDLSGVDWAPNGSGDRVITDAPATGVTETMEMIGWDLFYSEQMPDIVLDTFSLTFTEAIDDTTTTTDGGTTTTTTAPATSTTTAPSTTTTVPQTTTTIPVPTDAEITGGEMSWGVYENFVRYINGPIATGSVTTSEGASGAPSGPFLFPAVPGAEIDVTAADLSLSFTGAVGFEGHEYAPNPPALEMRFSNFQVIKTGTTGKLLADVTARPFIDTSSVAEPQTWTAAHLADLDFSQVTVGTHGDGVAWLQIPAKVSADGGPLFGDFYEAGQTLDPVTIRLSLTEIPDGLDDATPPPAVAGPVVVLGSSSVPAGGMLTVSSEGFTAGEQVEVWLHSTPTFLQMARADSEGRVRATVLIPHDAAIGAHRIELKGLSSGISAFSPDFQVTAGSGIRTAAGRGGTLSRTGSDSAPIAVVGMILVLTGAAILAPRAIRRTSR